MMQRIRFSYLRGENLKFISHLDILRFLHRAFRRADFNLVYRGKFNPQPRLDPGIPLPLGITSEKEYGEVYFYGGEETGKEFLSSIGAQLPGALMITGAEVVSLQEASLMEQIDCSRYRVYWKEESTGGELRELLERGTDKVLNAEKLTVQRRGKKKKGKRQMREVDIRPFIYSLNIEEFSRGLELVMLLQTGNRGGASPKEVMQVMEELTGEPEPANYHGIHREGLYRYDGGSLKPPPPFKVS